MSDQFWVSFFNSMPNTIMSIATLIAALGSLFVTFINTRKLDDVHKEVNGMKHELVASTAKASRSEGRAEGVKEEQDRISKSLPQEVVVVNEPLKVEPIKK